MFSKLWTAIPLIQQAAAHFISEGTFQKPSDESIYSPARPPAIPLAVRTPYSSIWSSTGAGNFLNSKDVIFWTGEEVGWEGVITVDNTSYEYMGAGFRNLSPKLKPNLSSAVTEGVEYDSSTSVFTFSTKSVAIKATFMSPVLPNDLCRSSVPLSYLNVTFTSLDGEPHDVQLYSDVSARMLAPDPKQAIEAEYLVSDSAASGNSTYSSSNVISTWEFKRDDSSKLEYGEVDEFAQWGSLVYSTSQGKASNFSYESGASTELRSSYLSNRGLSNQQGSLNRKSSSAEPVFAFAHDFGSSASGSVLYTIGTLQIPAVQYLGTYGLDQLQPWWTRCYNDTNDMISKHYREYQESLYNVTVWDLNLKTDIEAYLKQDWHKTQYDAESPLNATNGTDQYGTPYTFDPDSAFGWLNANDNSSGIAVPHVMERDSYYAIVALSARQTMGAYVLTTRPGTIDWPESQEPMMFQKEISSNGNVNTVDVMYPAMPFFLYTNPMLLKYMVDPLFLYQEKHFYPNHWSIHDIGAKFPNATGHIEGDDEAMQVEECGNMLLMTYAMYKFMDNATEGELYLRKHFSILQQWSQFLEIHALVPGSQLSTDDFAGRLANQTNLAIKGILGLQAMARISYIVNETALANKWAYTARTYYQKWETLAIDPSRQHTMLSYQHRSSWGTLYNIYPDKLLGLDIVPPKIYDMQSDWYPRVSQLFGVPLDSRHPRTKSDWEMWTAATCQPDTRRLFVNSLAYYLNHTEIDTPFGDLFLTIGSAGKPEESNFIARPVVGGHFSFLALLRARELEGGGIDGGD